MKKTALLGAALGLALSFGAASMASATVYTFTQSDPGAGLGAGPFGTVEVTQDVNPNALDFLVTLNAGELFHAATDGNHHALTFDLAGNPTITISGLPSGFTLDGSQAAGSNSDTPFGAFDYVINLPGHGTPYDQLTFSFVATGTAPLVLEAQSNLYNGKQIFFGSDISLNGATGNVGATLTPSVKGGVPEPATWAMMMIGFGGMGALLRRRRSQALALA